MVSITTTQVEEQITFAFHTIQSTASTKMDGRARDTCMALNMKSAVLTHLRKTFMTMRHRVPFASSSHVAHANDARTE